MAHRQQSIAEKTRYELVNVTMRHEDYDRLREQTISMNEQVSIALVSFLKQIRDDASPEEVRNAFLPDGDLRSIRCALPKSLCDQIRQLKGRFDLHTLEAVRLYLL
jgi:hypothetical protein